MGNPGSPHPTTFDSNDFDLDGCNISELIMFLQKLARSPNASAMNMAFTKHITNALMKIREEKLKQKVSIPRKFVGTPVYHPEFPLCIQFMIPGRPS
jgi:hypothetical protein